MMVGNIGSPDETIGISISHHVSSSLSIKGGALYIQGFLWYFEDTDFRIFSNESPAIHQWGSIRFKPNSNMTIYLKMSQSTSSVSTTIPAAESDNLQWIHNPNISSSSYDYKLPVSYTHLTLPTNREV